MVNYQKQLEEMISHDRSTIYVNFDHIWKFDCELAEAIELEYCRFDPYLRAAVHEVALKLGYAEYLNDVEKGLRYVTMRTLHAHLVESCCALLCTLQ